MYTSKNTSVNTTRAARAYTLAEDYNLLKGRDVLDYGCGRIEGAKIAWNKAKAAGARTWTGYDKYWNNETYYGTFDTIICANVLNVIEDLTDYRRILFDLIQALANGGCIIIQIYEGDGTGEGKETRPDCWQRNERLEDHAIRIRSFLELNHYNTGFNMIFKRYKGGNYIIIEDYAPF